MALLASDLDGTLIPPAQDADDGGTRAFRAALEERGSPALSYVTGRHLTLALRGIREHGLPVPDVLVCDVGTSVYVLRDGQWERNAAYAELVRTALGADDLADARARLEEVERLVLQEPENQTEFKLSFHAPGAGAGEELLERVRDALASGPKVDVVYSFDAATRQGALDVLPAGIAKHSAVRFLRDVLKLATEGLVYAGDSGNDRSAMLAGFDVVVVGNAAPELKESVAREAETLGLDDKIYFARASYARGVLEGCRHFGLL